MKVVSLAAAMKNLKALAKEASEGERIQLSLNGKVVAAIVPFEDAEYMQAKEDAIDVREAERILAKGGKTIPYEQVRRELGLHEVSHRNQRGRAKAARKIA